MRTSGNQSDVLLAIVPAVVMTVLVVMMLGGPDETMHTLDRFCRAVVSGAAEWVQAARRR
jgi:phosphoheptose isomerase